MREGDSVPLKVEEILGKNKRSKAFVYIYSSLCCSWVRLKKIILLFHWAQKLLKSHHRDRCFANILQSSLSITSRRSSHWGRQTMERQVLLDVPRSKTFNVAASRNCEPNTGIQLQTYHHHGVSTGSSYIVRTPDVWISLQFRHLFEETRCGKSRGQRTFVMLQEY